jgi:hypothetical protein
MIRFAVRAERAWSSLPYAIRLLAVLLAVAVAGSGGRPDPFRWD